MVNPSYRAHSVSKIIRDRPGEGAKHARNSPGRQQEPLENVGEPRRARDEVPGAGSEHALAVQRASKRVADALEAGVVSAGGDQHGNIGVA